MEHASKRARNIVPINTLPKELVYLVCSYLNCLDIWNFSEANVRFSHMIKGALDVWKRAYYPLLTIAARKWIRTCNAWELCRNAFSNPLARGGFQYLVTDTRPMYAEAQIHSPQRRYLKQWKLTNYRGLWVIKYFDGIRFKYSIPLIHNDCFDCLFNVITRSLCYLLDVENDKRHGTYYRRKHWARMVYLSANYLKFKRTNRIGGSVIAKVYITDANLRSIVKFRRSAGVLARLELTLLELYLMCLKSLLVYKPRVLTYECGYREDYAIDESYQHQSHKDSNEEYCRCKIIPTDSIMTTNQKLSP